MAQACRREVGRTLASTLRFHLTGRVAIAGSRTLDQAVLGGRQGRLALVYLLTERHRPVPVDELAAALWGDAPPRTWEPSLRVVVSRLRSALAEAGGWDAAILSEGGCYHAMVGDAWVDVEAATNAVDRAEGAWRHGDVGLTWSEATVAAGILRRPLLPGEDLHWVEVLRLRLRERGVRALDLLVRVYGREGDHSLAVAVGRDLVALEPYREASHRLLMRAHQASGDRAEAVRVHQRLRALLSDELGIDPAPETTALYLDILRDGTAPDLAGT